MYAGQQHFNTVRPALFSADIYDDRVSRLTFSTIVKCSEGTENRVKFAEIFEFDVIFGPSSSNFYCVKRRIENPGTLRYVRVCRDFEFWVRRVSRVLLYLVTVKLMRVVWACISGW